MKNERNIIQSGFSVDIKLMVPKRAVCLLVLLFICSVVMPVPVFSAPAHIKPIAQITTDADGLHLHYPRMLFYDSIAGETYLSGGSRHQVNIYARDFYPLISFSAGRGIYRPAGMFIDQNSMIYIAQSSQDDKPNRISVFNGAFIPVREIPLDNIPGAPDFAPRRLVVNHNGLIYVTSRLHRGVAVLDNDGVFLRWLRPEDMILYTWNLNQVEAEEKAENEEASGSAADQATQNEFGSEIPEEFRPKSKSEAGAEPELKLGPVMILAISIDSKGRLYLLSNETSKTYVYSPDETFLFSFGAKGGTPRTLSNPRGLAIDEDRHIIYVVDYMRHAVLAYDQGDGKYLFEFGGKGKGPGWFNFPTDVAVNQKGQVIVCDSFNDRVQVLEVKYERESPPPTEPDEPSSPQTESEQSKESSQDAGISGPQEESVTEETGVVQPGPEQSAAEKEIILDEEVIEESSPGKLPGGQSGAEPLETPESGEDRW